MPKKLLFFWGLFICSLFSSWGFYAHKRINQAAVFTLPSELAVFYKKYIDIITERAVDADKRCYVDSLESPRHFIDIDEYTEDVLDSIPVHWSKAKEKYQEKKLLAQGIVPWQIAFTYQKLIKAFREKEPEAIIKHTADLGHYIADAHVPLHTTSNYNGQQTGQIGIHAFWESRLPEMFASSYNLLVGKAQYVRSPLDSAWQIIKESHALVDSVLLIEKNLSKEFPPHLQRSYIPRNNILVATYSDQYASAYHYRMNGMVERRMRQSIQRIGSFWMSAWIDAGQPQLRSVYDTRKTSSSSEQSSGRILGREEWH